MTTTDGYFGREMKADKRLTSAAQAFLKTIFPCRKQRNHHSGAASPFLHLQTTNNTHRPPPSRPPNSRRARTPPAQACNSRSSRRWLSQTSQHTTPHWQQTAGKRKRKERAQLTILPLNTPPLPPLHRSQSPLLPATSLHNPTRSRKRNPPPLPTGTGVLDIPTLEPKRSPVDRGAHGNRHGGRVGEAGKVQQAVGAHHGERRARRVGRAQLRQARRRVAHGVEPHRGAAAGGGARGGGGQGGAGGGGGEVQAVEGGYGAGEERG